MRVLILVIVVILSLSCTYLVRYTEYKSQEEQYTDYINSLSGEEYMGIKIINRSQSSLLPKLTEAMLAYIYTEHDIAWEFVVNYKIKRIILTNRYALKGSKNGVNGFVCSDNYYTIYLTDAQSDISDVKNLAHTFMHEIGHLYLWRNKNNKLVIQLSKYPDKNTENFCGKFSDKMLGIN